jgi:OmpA-OmpF porin, OOP family
MTRSLMDSILRMVTRDMKHALASRLGESLEGVQSGLGAATAATLSGLDRKAADREFLGQILGLLDGGAGPSIVASLPSIAGSAPTGTAAETISSFVRMLFGSQQAEVAGAISQHAGLSATSGPALLKVSAAVVLAYFAKGHNVGALTVESLSSTLRAEAPTLHSYLPASLLPGAPAAASSIPRRAVFAPSAVAARTPRWLVPLAVAGALLIGGLLIRALSGPGPPQRTAPKFNTKASTTSDAARAAWAALGDMMRVKLPNGSELNVPSLGVEAKLMKFLNDSSAPVTENSGFDFDRLLFDTGHATVRPVSQEQLTNIAAILKAYPRVKVRIGGYTDNTGDPADNLQLSQQRADNVMEELSRLGVDASRMSAKGYGQENPMADNSTEEGRQKNRRISLWVTEKLGPAT